MALYTPYSTEEEKKRQQELQQQNAQKMYDPADTNNSQQYQKAQQPQQNQQGQQPAGFTYQPYTPSSTVQQAQALLQQQLAAKPAGYTSKWQGSIDDTLSQILNRDKFSYDINEDAMYQQLAQQYALYGKQAMMDTVGQVSGLTGGYGNSYAQSAGQQAYQGYLQRLNDRVPEFYQMALTRYNQQGEDLLNRYGMLAQQEGQDYARYQDDMNAYLSELNRLQEEARYADETEYGRYMDWVAQQRYQQELAYQQEQDRIAQDRYQQEFAYQQEQDRIAQEQWQKQHDESVRQWQKEYDFAMQQYLDSQKASSGGSGSGGSGGGGGKYNAGTAELQQKLRAAGYDIAVDGIMGPKTKAALDDYNAKQQNGPSPLAYEDPEGTGNDGYYDQLLGAVSTAKGAYNKQNATVRQQTYKETVAAINDAYNSGRITAAQKQSLLRIATPGTR